MKKTTIGQATGYLLSTAVITGAVLLVTLLAGSAYAFEVHWPVTPVIGVVGASFADCSLPMDSPRAGAGYIGCSYEALEKKLTKNHHIDKMGMTVQSTAQAGSRSSDMPGTDMKGYSSQFDQLMVRTTWPFDNEQRLQYVVVSIVNDCLHSLPCTVDDMQTAIGNTKQMVTTATDAGITVIMNGYPAWEDLDLQTTTAVFGLTYVIDEDDYRLLQQMHEEQLSAMPGVVYAKVWEDNFATVDGLHPLPENQVEAADRIARLIRDMQKEKR